MSEQIKIVDQIESPLGWIFLEATALRLSDEAFGELLEKTNYSETGVVNIELTVNGQTFPVMEAFTAFKKAVDIMIEDKARELLSEKRYELFGKIDSMIEQLNDNDN